MTAPAQAPGRAASARPLRVALAGNPNAGKTSLFNALTGHRAKVANYPGVTVERREARLEVAGRSLELVDVPGTYSLTARALDEEVAHDTIIGCRGLPPADVIVSVVDASNLARNLYLTLQLMEFERPLLVALNMMDLAREAGHTIDVSALSTALGVPVVPVVGRTGEGVDALREAMARSLSPSRPVLRLASSDAALAQTVQQALRAAGQDGSLGHALWQLTRGEDRLDELDPALRSHILDARAAGAEPLDPARPDNLNRRLIAARYAAIDPIVGTCLDVARPSGPSKTERLDRVMTHPIWGTGIFILSMALLFQAIFAWSDPLIGLVEDGMAAFAGLVSSMLPDGVVRELVVDGLIAGVGNVLVFLPQILLLFLGIAILEDTGYMARVAFLLDRVMRRVGLNGKAFLPLLSSFACAIPGVMAARTIEGERDRLLTILIAPLMSCSARLPVYTLVIAAVFSTADPVFGFLSLGGLIITAMYFLGIAAALLVAWIVKRAGVRSPAPPFVLELPSYKRPVAVTVLDRMLRRGWVFVTQTGAVIIALSIVLWALMSYPRVDLPETEAQAIRTGMAQSVEQPTEGEAEDPDVEGRSAEVDEALAKAAAQYQLRESIAGHIGRAIEPVIAPLGFDWKIGIGLVGSFAAREVLVSTLGQVYGVGADVDEESVVLRDALRADIDPATGEPRFTPLVGLSLMVFFVLAMQCLSTVAVVRRETNSWKWPIVMILYMNGLAWIGSLLTFQVGRLLGFG